MNKHCRKEYRKLAGNKSRQSVHSESAGSSPAPATTHKKKVYKTTSRWLGMRIGLCVPLNLFQVGYCQLTYRVLQSAIPYC